MPDPNQDLLDHNVRRQIFLERHSEQVAQRIIRQTQSVQVDILAQLANIEIGEAARLRLESLLAQLDAIVASGVAQVAEILDEELEAVTASEIRSQTATLTAAAGGTTTINLVAPAAVYAAAQADPMRGRLLRDWYTSLEQSQQTRLQQALRIGFAEGQSLQQIINRIRGTRVNGFRDGVLEAGRRDIESIVRTSMTHFASRANQAVMASVPELAERYLWVSVVDSRTSQVCMARSGKTYKVGSGPLPPAHFRCRSTVTPLLMNRPAPNIETYAEWLSRQSREVVEDILGPTRAKLFLAGKLPLTKFVREPYGRVLTLAELERREQTAWRRAGLSAAA